MGEDPALIHEQPQELCPASDLHDLSGGCWPQEKVGILGTHDEESLVSLIEVL